uniref:hypothetical protein n=1 Tax=Clostridium sp. ATCC 25772 TaxID=1676991 RepID=UPI000A911BFE
NSLWEVIKMLEENNELKFKNDRHVIGSSELGFLKLIETTYSKKQLEGNINLASEWELARNPVTFEEVLNSNKKCRVEHELIDSGLDDEITSNDNVTLEDYQTLKEGNYMELHNLISVLPWILSNEEFKQVIKEGKWYLED